MRMLLSVSLLAMAVMTSGCSQLFGGLRHDMNDQQAQQPQGTVGGQWPEHDWLADDDMSVGGSYSDNQGGRFDTLGHSDRSPASAGYGNAGPGSNSWVTPDDATANQRDGYRGAGNGASPSFASAPNVAPPMRREYKNGSRATAADFIDDSPNEGSLWASTGQTNYYFTKNRVPGVGDIVSVKTDAALIRDVGAEIQRTLTSDEKSAELQAAQARMSAQPAGGAQAGGGPAPASVQQSSAASAQTATDKDIDVTKSIDLKAGDPIMAEIVERYPNGNYKIRGSKKVIYSNGAPRMLTFEGVVKGSDIGDDDSVDSGKLYEYRLQASR